MKNNIIIAHSGVKISRPGKDGTLRTVAVVPREKLSSRAMLVDKFEYSLPGGDPEEWRRCYVPRDNGTQ